MSSTRETSSDGNSVGNAQARFPSGQQTDGGLFVPEIYRDGYAEARKVDPVLAEEYIRHTTIGDPLADAMVADISSLSPGESQTLIQAVMESEEDVLAQAPESVQALYHDANTTPDWVDLNAMEPGIRSFHANAPEILGGMVGGVLVEGFSTAICESFLITGRLREQGVRRLKQNNRHMMESFLPGGLERFGDGWRLSVRIRIVHSRIRHLLNNQPEDWDFNEMGMPVSAAHVGFAISSFSARLLQHAVSLGASFSAAERASFMQVWRYSGHLMGIPASILYKEESDALKLREIALLCEPEPSFSSIIMANALINSAPLVIGIQDSEARRDLVKYVYTISTALIGKELAAQLRYPSTTTLGVLPLYRFRVRFKRLFNRFIPGWNRSSNFEALIEASMFDQRISYGLPDHAHAERSRQW